MDKFSISKLKTDFFSSKPATAGSSFVSQHILRAEILLGKFENALSKGPGRASTWVFVSVLCYLSASLLPALDRGADTMAGYECLLWGPLSLVANSPLVFLIWLLNFEILFSMIEVLSPYPVRSARRTRISLAVGLLLFSGMTLLVDHLSGQAVPLAPRAGAFLWYFSMCIVYIARLKKQRTPLAPPARTPEEWIYLRAEEQKFTPADAESETSRA